MLDFSAIDVAAVVGLTALVLLTLNILMGLLVSVNYNTRKQWPYRQLPAPLFRIHNWTGYCALAVAMLHPIILLFVNARQKFRVIDILFPWNSPFQSSYNFLGAMALWGFALVAITSHYRPKLGYRPWKKLHYTAYFAAALMFAHGVIIDQNLKGQAPDFLDGEKVLVEGCFLVVVAAAIWRWRYGTEKQRFRAKAGVKVMAECD